MSTANGPFTGLSANLLCLIAVLLLFTLANIDKTNALGHFRNGRYDNGFLGEPSKFESLRVKPEPEDQWFEQKLDHFGEKNKDVTWKQRYFVNDEFYRNDSTAPIFLMIGGEGEASKRWMSQGAWIKYAEHFGALCFQLEHRFYGKSHPTSDLSTKNLVYLTSEQALSDLANFIRSMKKQYNMGDKQKWIVFGGSYPGSLAAWAREKYPDLIHGAISSSGPLLAKVDFKEYFEVVKASLATHSDECLLAVGRAFAQVEILTRHMIGQRSLDEKFKTCTPIKDSIENPLDMSNFFESLAGNFAGVVQYNKDNRPSSTYTIDDLCNVMVNTTIGPPVTRLGVVNDMLLKDSKEKCLDYKYDKMIAELKETSWDAKACNGSRQWTYQTCNEFGFYQTSNNKSDTFGDRFAVDFFIKQCMDIYSESDLSLENLQFLSSRQALADVANFIQGMNREYNFDKTQKWIVFGGSYPGALAAWARQKYPHLIHGAISSSAPLLAIVDFVEYLEVVKASLATHSPSCPEAVGHAFAEIETLTHHEIGQRNLDEKFNTCTPIRDSVANSLDMSNFFETLADNIAGVVQLNRNNTSAGHSWYTIDEICDVMVNTTIGPPVARLGIVSGMLLEKSEEKCFVYKYDKKLEDMRNTSWEAKAANWTRQWTYQTCNEFGYFQTSNKKNDTFGDRFKVDFFIKQCMDIYSVSMDAKYLERVVSQTNEYYGGLRPNTTNVLYVHGSIDPWHALGLTSAVDPNVPTIYIEGTAHCADMYDQAETDPPQLVEAREKTRKFIEQLLNQETNEISKFL